jgi:Flp pilus assembly protein TadB
MWEMARTSMIAFLRGRLFASFWNAMALAILGLALVALVFVVLVKAGVPLLVAAPAVAFAGGILQPRLYKNLKYR